MENVDQFHPPSPMQQDVDCSSENRERSVELPFAVTVNNSINRDSSHSASFNDINHSSPYGSSFDDSSVDSSVLTSSLSSFEFSGQQDVTTPSDQPAKPSVFAGDESSNEDEVAEVVSDLIQNRGTEMSLAIAERISCIDSIKWLGHHLPESVVAFLVDEIEVEEAGRGPISDSEMNGFASSMDFLDYETSQGHQHDDDRSLPDLDLTAYPPQNQQRPKQAPEHHHDGTTGCDNGSAVLIKNENGKETEDSCRNSHPVVDATVNVQLNHDGCAKRSRCHSKTIMPDHDDSFALDESAGYYADYHESRNGIAGDFFEHSNVEQYMARYNDTGIKLVHDENDLDDDLNRASNDPLHHDNRHYRSQRRHSVMGLKSTLTTPEASEFGRASVEVKKPRSRVQRRSSMPLVVRSMDTTERQSRRGSIKPTFAEHVSDSSSGGSGSSLRFHKETNHRKYTRRMKRRGSAVSGNSISSFLREPLGALEGFSGMNSSFGGAGSVKDTIPYSSDDEKRELLRRSRVLKTRDSILKLSGDVRLGGMENQLEELESEDEGEFENMYFTDAIPPATRHDCALLFVDISGFTKLSTTLEVEPLSKTINNYFQMIVDEVEAFGGDILKFAGDAVFCEWQATTSNPLETGDGISLSGSSQGSIEPWHGLGLEECVLTAAACGARIVDKCSDYPVYDGIGSSGTQVATLNVHCGLGFGEVVGVHVGDRESRMEYVILGDPIEQVAEAILCASRGEVVASPDALVILEETSELDARITNGDMTKPQVIASKSSLFFRPKGNFQIQQMWSVARQNLSTKPRERLAKRCDDWATPALTRLRQRMALYVHPVVVNDESAAKIYPGDRNRAQERHRSEAELRDVYTVFIMPMITARLTGDDEEDCDVLVLLNDIMLIMTRELARFKGHLRQFIVDDKGVVLIANFGLRGSTFPNMVAERAIPFTTTVQTLLKAELSTDCQIGATFGKAYCGVVGGVSRHEYAVLGPSVNLAARLMGDPQNTGFLVDESVKEKAGRRHFRALPPVEAKGYRHPVPIFEPLQTPDPLRDGVKGIFVGREVELSQIVAMTDGLVENGGPAKFLLVSGDSGVGKSALCRQASEQIKEACARNGIPHLNIGVASSEGDVFVPFSIVRPLFLEILNYLFQIENPDAERRDIGEIVDADEIAQLLQGTLAQEDAPESLLHLVQICEMVDIPDHFIEILGKLVLTRNRADVVDSPNNPLHMLKLNQIASYVVNAFLNCTVSFDLVILALDEVANMDEMSWKIVELLFNNSQNMLILATTKHMDQAVMKASEDFWTQLHVEGVDSGHFKEISLDAIPQSDVEQLVANRLGQREREADPQVSRDVFMESGELPNITSELVAQWYTDDSEPEHREYSGHDSQLGSPVATIDVGNIGEIVLHRMDSLPSTVRTHLNLGAILGSAFELMDVVTVFEQYRDVTKDGRLEHAQAVHESLDQAVKKGILEVTNKESAVRTRYNTSEHPYAAHNIIFKFTHDVWRSNILRLTLDEWKKDMHNLIAQSMETVMDSQPANDYQVLTRLFSHWKGSGRAKEAATLALQMGRNLEDMGLTHQSLIVYRESLDMWKAMDNSNEVPDDSIGGLSVNLLGSLESSDVEHLIKLNVALGRCYTNILDPQESVKCFQTALNFIHKAPPSSRLEEDRSIIFPVFNGLFFTLRFGHNTNVDYEKGLVDMFMKETQCRNDPVHYSIALAMRAEMLVRHGGIEPALETVRDLTGMYNVELHSNRIATAYGSDRAGQCISQSALWNQCLGRHEQALGTCDFVINELLPHMDPQNVYNSFHMLYPIIWVMKDSGRAPEALEAFNRIVVHNFTTRLDARGLTSDRPLHTPIIALLDMVGTNCETDRLDEYAEWALVEQNGLFGSELNLIMGSAGRTADSLTAEICLLLAGHTSDSAEKSFFIRKGYEVARDAMALTRATERSSGMVVAFSQVEPIFVQLERLYSTTDL